MISPGSNACSPRSTISSPAWRPETSGNFPTSRTRSPEITTAPFSIGGPSIVTTTRARRIISFSWRDAGATVSRYSDAAGAAAPVFTTVRHSATSRLHGSWQSNGIAVAGVADPGPFRAVVWSCDGSNFSAGNFVDAIVLSWSRFQRIVRKHPLSDRQKFPTTLSICSSEIFAATRYIPDCRSKVSRNGVVCS